MPQLIVSEPERSPVAIDLREPVLIGRDPQNSLPLIYKAVSRLHAVFEPDGDQWIVRDLGSANGTFVNRVRVNRWTLADGDIVQIGLVKLVFREDFGPQILLTLPQVQDVTLDLDGSNRRLQLLYEVTRAIGAIEDPDKLIERIPGMVSRLLKCERVMVALTDKSGRTITRQIVHACAPGASTNDIPISRTILQAVLERRESVTFGNRDETPPTLASQGILSAMCAPLEAQDRVFGLLYADDLSYENQFNSDDLDFFRILGRLVAAMLNHAEGMQRLRALSEGVFPYGPLNEIIGNSAAIRTLRNNITKVAANPAAHVLIRGESGSGKERVARALHATSARAGQPFVTVQCASIPDTMIECVLFGYEKGAFSGAVQSRRGQFVLADCGTLLLDEIGDLSLAAQGKVLRLLEEGEVLPLGSETAIRVDVRVIATTHRDLRREIAEKRFREDLYYRINVLEIEVPPLRECEADIDVLAHAYLDMAAINLGKRLQGFTPAALAALRAYSWPGNVRELKNEVARVAVYVEHSHVDVGDLSPTIHSSPTNKSRDEAPNNSPLATRFAALDRMERTMVEEALQNARGNLAEAARLLGITRIMMRNRVDKFGLRNKDG